jgi:hypothetical protein
MKDLLKEYAERYYYHVEHMSKYEYSDRMYFFHDGAAMIAKHAYDRLNWKLVATGQVKTFAPPLTK